MPVSLSSKLLFVHIPRTGGTAINRALLAAGCYGDARLDYLRTEMNVPYGVLTCPGTALELGHCLLRHYETFLTRSMFTTCFAFAVVRDPVDKAVSEFLYKIMHKSDRGFGPTRDFNRFLYNVHRLLDRRDRLSHYQLSHFLPQADYVRGASRTLDRMIRFEDLATQVPAMLAERGVVIELPLLNAKEGHFVPTAAQRRMVEAIYADDFEIWESAR